LEAFKIFDEDGTGLIPINSFRYFMLKYAKMDPAEMDDMICDILGLKRITPLDPATKVDYKEFGKKLFDKNYGKGSKSGKEGKGGKGGKSGKK
jgi:Ca2+-binding EF-hand superfamily protein